MRRAEITVFLSLVFILVMSFILGLTEITVIHTSKNLSRLETDRAVFSIFGEYQKKLLEEYHVFAIEGSYGTGDFTEDRLIGRMHYYENADIDHEITDIQFLTDNHGQAFREQVTAYMEDRYGIGVIRDFTGKTAEWEEQRIQGEKIREDESQLRSQLEELKEGAKTESETGVEENDEESKVSYIEQIEKSGILSVVMPRDMELSGRKIDPEKQASGRALNTGRGSFPSRTGMDGIEERLLFNEYILQNFTNASAGSPSEEEEADGDLSKEKGRSLAYEAEYILSGKPSDKENLEAVLMKLFLVRLALNYAFLLGNSGKQAEAEMLAVTISILLLIPQGTEIVKQLLLIAWAAGESAADIRTLLSGKKVPLVKTDENWQVSLSELFIPGGSTAQSEGKNTADGISYEDYLRAFLFLADQEDTVMRSLDRIEENLAARHEMDFFKADHCVTKMKIKNTALIFGELTYTYPVSFGYE